MGIIEQLRSDAEDHIGVAYSCDCNPEDTINWRHAENAHEAAKEIEQLRAKVAELESRASPASVPEGQKPVASVFADGDCTKFIVKNMSHLRPRAKWWDLYIVPQAPRSNPAS